jgi:hypothetical protein
MRQGPATRLEGIWKIFKQKWMLIAGFLEGLAKDVCILSMNNNCQTAEKRHRTSLVRSLSMAVSRIVDRKLKEIQKRRACYSPQRNIPSTIGPIHPIADDQRTSEKKPPLSPSAFHQPTTLRGELGQVSLSLIITVRHSIV